MNWNPGPGGAQTNISNFPFNEREIKNHVSVGLVKGLVRYGK